MQLSNPQPTVSTLLKYWREVRHKTQLELALDADISQRHLSFIESGRSSPSREMVLTLASALNLPYRERNGLLLAAGFAPTYRESNLSEDHIEPVKRALDLILTNQEPFPAVVMDRYWNIVMTNQAAVKFFGLFVELDHHGAGNVLRMMFHPSGVRPFVMNWERVAMGLIQRVFREAVGGYLDELSQSLLKEILSYPGVNKSWQKLDTEIAAHPLIPVEFRKEDLEFSFFSAVTTLGTPQDIALQEIRIESFFPADDLTRQAATNLLSR